MVPAGWIERRASLSLEHFLHPIDPQLHHEVFLIQAGERLAADFQYRHAKQIACGDAGITEQLVGDAGVSFVIGH